MHIKNKKGQSTVEYILLVTAVVAVMIVFATNSGGPLQTQLNTTLTNVVNEINSEAGELANSHPTGGTPPAGAGTPGYTVPTGLN